MRADRKHEPRENEERWNTAGSFGQGRAREAFDDEWLRLKEEALIRIDEERHGLRPPFVATNITDFLRSVEATDARNHQALEALDARNRQALEALETRHRQALEAYIAYDAPALPTTTARKELIDC